MMEIVIFLAIFLILLVCVFSIISSYNKSRRPEYSEIMKKRSIALFVAALICIGLGTGMKMDLFNLNIPTANVEEGNIK